LTVCRRTSNAAPDDDNDDDGDASPTILRRHVTPRQVPAPPERERQ
jgi:hypothetical protein